jgi:hypothetical protein
MMRDEERIETYRFSPPLLALAARKPGISGFMRVKNGEDFLDAAIRSHMPHLDEMVVAYNGCTDSTPDILQNLKGEFGPKLRIFHYLPEVSPPGSDRYKREAANSPKSFINYSNFALAQTRHTVVTMVDDDHLAMPERISAIVRRVRAVNYSLKPILCFSGINLAFGPRGVGVYGPDPFVGNGDHWFLMLDPHTYFVYDRRFERLNRSWRAREFSDFSYWHLKHLKRGYGYLNHVAEGSARQLKKRDQFLANQNVSSLEELRDTIARDLWLSNFRALVPDKYRLKLDRCARFVANCPTLAEYDQSLRAGGLGSRPQLQLADTHWPVPPQTTVPIPAAPSMDEPVDS